MWVCAWSCVLNLRTFSLMWVHTSIPAFYWLKLFVCQNVPCKLFSYKFDFDIMTIELQRYGSGLMEAENRDTAFVVALAQKKDEYLHKHLLIMWLHQLLQLLILMSIILEFLHKGLPL